MAQLLLVNPKPRKKGKTSTTKKGATKMARKKRRTAKQIAATKKLVALNRSRRRKSPSAKRRARTVTKTKTVYRNPAPRIIRRKTAAKKSGVVNQMIIPAAKEATGAVMLDVAMGYLKPRLPATMQTGIASTAVKGMVAIGLGLAAGKFTKSTTARDLAKGGLVVTMHDFARSQIAKSAPNIPLGAYDDDFDLMGWDDDDLAALEYGNAIQFDDEAVGELFDHDYSMGELYNDAEYDGNF